MKQTPVHDAHNPDLLAFIPPTSSRLIEVGCSAGALAREFKKIHPNCHYLGIDIDATYVDLAKRYCDECLTLDIEAVEDDFYQKFKDVDCWIFGDTLEHLKDPWCVLSKIRQVIPAHGCVVVCIPNAQHWSMMARLSVGDFRYQDSGLMDRRHIRWFTRQTMIELFEQNGFRIEAGQPRIFNEPHRELFLPLIAQLASLAGGNAKLATQDALALQYVLRAVVK